MAGLTRTQRETAATKYSVHYSPSCPLILKKVYEVKQANKMKHNRTRSEDVSLVHVINGY